MQNDGKTSESNENFSEKKEKSWGRREQDHEIQRGRGVRDLTGGTDEIIMQEN